MQAAPKQAAKFVLIFLLCGFHLWIYTHLPAMQKGADWPNVVLHNWHEYGYWNLGGQLVANPGGLDAGEKQFIYPGHRPYLLLPPYWLKELPGKTGGNGLFYDLVMVIATFVGLTRLFGSGGRGFLIASVVCLCPGFILNVAAIDTISFPAVMGLAALPFAAALLADGETKITGRLLALAVMILFMLMNWSTLFSLFVLIVYLCAKHPGKWKNFVLYLGLASVVGLAVFAVSMSSRHAGGSTVGDYWNAYLWGPAGYDRGGMNLQKALVRISGVNMIAWLPLVVAGFVLWLRNGLGERWRIAPLPLAAAIFAVFVMRNYNAHHPWGAVSIIGLGLLFSLELFIAPGNASQPARSGAGFAAAAAFSLIYCVAWLALDEFNKRDDSAIYTLITQNTPRHGLVVVMENLTTDGRMQPDEFSSMVDRKLVTAADWESHHDESGRGGGEIFFLTHENPPIGSHVIAQSEIRPQLADKIMVPLFDFYRAKISRRAPGDRKLYFTEYWLYQLPVGQVPRS